MVRLKRLTLFVVLLLAISSPAYASGWESALEAVDLALEGHDVRA